MEKLFPRVREIVCKYRQLCNFESGGFSHGRPFVNTEVWNEGWMLRLIVAKLHDLKRVVGNEVAKDICAASKVGWCSEGRLFPLFKGERSTRADGIVGNIILRNEKKWGFELDRNCPRPRIVALEAKMNSALSKGVKAADDFDQSARYLACLSGLVSQMSNANAALYVIVPDCKKSVVCPILAQGKKRLRDEIEKMAKGHELRAGLDAGKIGDALGSVVAKIVTWDELIGAIPDVDPDKKFIRRFYTDARTANGVINI